MMFTELIVTIVIIALVYIVVLRTVFSIGEIVKNLQEQTEESKKQTAYQKAIYKKIKIIMVSQGINEEDTLKKLEKDEDSL